MTASQVEPVPRDGKVAVRAAGAVVWRPGLIGPEVALIHRPRYDDWSFPKGKLDPGENYVRAAVREIYEETGFPVLLGRRLPTQLYPVSVVGGAQRLKRVKYWAAQAAADADFQPNVEVDRLEWLPVFKASRRLTRQADVALLDAFAALPVDTAPILLLRHATAVPRRLWDGADVERPLSDVGFDEARALVSTLAAYGDSTLVTSPSARCVETLEPYAKESGEELFREDALSEAEERQAKTKAKGQRAAAKWLDSVLERGQPTVACTHRPVLPELLGASAAGTSAWAGKRPLAPAEAWALHVRHGSAVAVDRVRL